MKSFYDWYTESKDALLLPSPATAGSSATKVGDIRQEIVSRLLNVPMLANDKHTEFVRELARIVSEDKFVQAFSERLGKPFVNEAQEDFLQRARKVFGDLVDETLSQKK